MKAGAILIAAVALWTATIASIPFAALTSGGSAQEPVRAGIITAPPRGKTELYALAKNESAFASFPVAALPTFTPVPTPTQVPRLAPIPSGGARAAVVIPYSVEQWRSLVASIWPAENVEGVLRIMRCESGGDPNVEGIGGRGLMQINPYVHGDYEYWRDPLTNLQKAYALSRGGTYWGHWDGPTPGRGLAWYNGAECNWKPS